MYTLTFVYGGKTLLQTVTHSSRIFSNATSFYEYKDVCISLYLCFGMRVVTFVGLSFSLQMY